MFLIGGSVRSVVMFLLRGGLSIVAAATLALSIDARGAEDAPPLTPSSPPALSQPHPFGVHDMVRMQRVGEPQPSPDGKWIVFTVRSWDPEANKTTTNLWLAASDGSSS